MPSLRPAFSQLIDNNPITVQVLGLCSALAVTSALLPALIMSLAVIAVLTFSAVIVSLLRHQIPDNVRLVLQITIVASAVIVVDEILKAFAPNVSRVLSVFVGLIITNCIVLSRTDTFAMHNRVWPSFLDGLGNGLGYALILTLVGALRELLGSGSLLGYWVLPTAGEDGWYERNELMLLAPSAFFLIALLIWSFHGIRRRRPAQRRLPSRAGASRADVS
jgi:Na+-transporting NADH:ubiquinone oxidoreductase subunit D